MFLSMYAYVERGQNQTQAEHLWIRISSIIMRSYIWIRTFAWILFDNSTCAQRTQKILEASNVY